MLIDLFDFVIARANAAAASTGGDTYTTRYYAVGTYGSIDPATGVWDGVMGELTQGRADASAALLTLTTDRVSAVAFSVPFISSGKTVLSRAAGATKDNWFFLRPVRAWPRGAWGNGDNTTSSATSRAAEAPRAPSATHPLLLCLPLALHVPATACSSLTTRGRSSSA